MEMLYHNTSKIIEEINTCLTKLENCTGTNSSMIENEIQTRIDQVTSNCEKMEILATKEPPMRRQNARLRVDQVKYDCQHLQHALRAMQFKRHNREQAQRDREALMTRRFEPNEQDTAIMIDYSLQTNMSLGNSNRGVDDMLNQGSAILGNLREQRSTMKKFHKTILDIKSHLNLSNAIMRLIEKRTYQDKFILFGGMIVTCVIMIVLIKYFYF